VRAGVEHAVAKAIETKLPPLADAKLAELLASPPQPQLIGRALRIDVVPNAVEIATLGLVVAAHTAVVVSGGEGGRYVAQPVATGAGLTGDAGVWIAADTINQLLAGLWAAHAFERVLERSKVGPLAMLLDEQVQSIQLTLSLPPTVTADTKLELAIGDLILSARDARGTEVQRFAVSLRSDVQIKAGELGLADAEPVVHAQLLAQSAALTRPLDGAAVEGVVKGAWSLVAGMIDDALAHVPIPGAGNTVELRSMTARGGAIVLELAVK